MNLIEQLGGYGKANSIFLSNEDDFSFYSVEHQYYSDKPIHRDSINIENLEENLLQYRREHNIFEYGDLVVFKDEPVIRSITSVFKVVNFGGDNIGQTLILDSINGGDGFGYIDQLRHATPEEIEAGRRLEVCGG